MRILVRLVFIVVLAGLLVPALAEAFTPELIAGKGDLLSGNVKLVSTGPPAVDALGDVAMRAIAVGTARNVKGRTGILFYSGTVPTLVAAIDSNQGRDPVTGSEFTKLSDPALSGSGVLAFLGTLKTGNGVTSANDQAVWIYNNGVLSIAARTGGTAATILTPASATGIFTRFTQLAVSDSGRVALLAAMKLNGVSTTAALESQTTGTYSLLVNKGSTGNATLFAPLAYVSGQSRSFDTINGNWAILADDTAQRTTYIILAQSDAGGFSLSAKARAPGALSNPDLQFAALKTLHEPAVNANGNAAFYATLIGNNINATNDAGVCVVTATADPTVVARTGDPAPDASGNPSAALFSRLSDPVFNNNDHVAFIGTLKTSGTTVPSRNDTGIWSDFNGTMELIVAKGQVAPGSTGKFSAFKQIALPDVGGVIFQATLSGVPAVQNQGVWAMTAGGLTPVVITGQQLDFHGTPKPVRKIGIFQLATSVLGQSRSFEATTSNLVFQATFKDGTWGVYELGLAK